MRSSLGIGVVLLLAACGRGGPDGSTERSITSEPASSSYSSGGPDFDIEALFKNHSAAPYRVTDDDIRSIGVLSTVPPELAADFADQVAQGPNFASRYRIVELPDQESEKLYFIVDYKARRGKELGQFERRIGANTFFTIDSFGLLLAYNEYPSGDCIISGWLFNEDEGEFVPQGEKTVTDDPGCQIQGS